MPCLYNTRNYIYGGREIYKKSILAKLDFYTSKSWYALLKPHFIVYNNYVLQELKKAFEPDGWLLTVHILGKRHAMDSYNIKAVSDTVDYINLAAYEYNGPSDRKTGIMAPLNSTNENNVVSNNCILFPYSSTIYYLYKRLLSFRRDFRY